MIIYRKDPDPYQMIWIRITDWYAKNPFIKKGNYLRQTFLAPRCQQHRRANCSYF